MKEILTQIKTTYLKIKQELTIFTFSVIFILWPIFAIYFSIEEKDVLKGIGMLFLPYVITGFALWIIEVWCKDDKKNP